MSYLIVYKLSDKARTSSLQIRLISIHCSDIIDIYRTWYGDGTDLVWRWYGLLTTVMLSIKLRIICYPEDGILKKRHNFCMQFVGIIKFANKKITPTFVFS